MEVDEAIETRVPKIWSWRWFASQSGSRNFKDGILPLRSIGQL